jgi:hypothetical protein
MNIGRNDPCPCGSGRKYKQCCQRQDAEQPCESGDPLSARDIRRVQEAMRAVARSESTWEADVIPVMARFEDGKSARPLLVLISAGDAIIHHDMRGHLRGGGQFVAEVLAQAVTTTAKDAGTYPERLRVRHSDVADALAPLLAAREVRVDAGETEQLAAAVRPMIEAVAGVHMWPPVCQPECWSAWDLPHALVKGVFAAAANFYRLAPWRDISNLQAPRVLLPSGRSWNCCILGNAGQEFGLVLYEHATDLFDVVANCETPDEPFAGVRGRIVSVTFSSGKLAGSEAVREARLRHWEIAGPAAYPQLLTVNTPGGGVTPDEVADLAALLEALPRFVQAHRLALRGEERTGKPVEPIKWQDEIGGIVFQYAGEAAWDMMREQARLDGLPPEMCDALHPAFSDSLEEAGEDADDERFLALLNERLRAGTDRYNERPQPDFGGLSPTQVLRLLTANWDAPDSAVRLRDDLSLNDVAHTDKIVNARALLTLAIDRGGFVMTQAGNIKPDIVAELLEQLQLDGELLRVVREDRRIKEQDIWPLHKMRVVCTLAGLLKRRGQRLEAARKAERLIEPERAGELYALLFRTWFRRFNLAYGTRGDWPELQHQVAYTLYRLRFAAQDWRTADDLLNEVVLPYALENAPRSPEMGDLIARVLLEARILDTLVGFGLLKRRSVGAGLSERKEYTVSELLERFIRCEV